MAFILEIFEVTMEVENIFRLKYFFTFVALGPDSEVIFNYKKTFCLFRKTFTGTKEINCA